MIGIVIKYAFCLFRRITRQGCDAQNVLTLKAQLALINAANLNFRRSLWFIVINL